MATTTVINAKTKDLKNKIPGITNLATNYALTAVENEIPKFNKLIPENFTIRLVQVN